MILTAMVAAAENNAIGKDNDLLWHLPKDMKFFKETTSGHAVIMGRKTLESFKRPLPNRENIVITRQTDYHPEGVHIVHSLDEAVALAKTLENEECFVLGGGEIYKQSIHLCDRVYLTRVHASFSDAEAYFPELDLAEWEEAWREEHPVDERHAYAYTFLRYERKS